MSNTILVVEDEEVTRDILATWLEEAGYDTCTAGNGFEGLIEVKQSSPDLVVTDIMMPQMDGYELCRLTREVSGAPFIFLTGLATANNKREAYKSGATEYLVKPIEMDNFLAKVAELLALPQSSGPPEMHTIQELQSKSMQSADLR